MTSFDGAAESGERDVGKPFKREPCFENVPRGQRDLTWNTLLHFERRTDFFLCFLPSPICPHSINL